MVFGKDCKREIKGRDISLERKKLLSKRNALIFMLISGFSVLISYILGIRDDSADGNVGGAGGGGGGGNKLGKVGMGREGVTGGAGLGVGVERGVKIEESDYSKLSGWRYIIIHHSAIDIGDKERYKKYHKTKYKSGGLLYHFVIGNGYGDGTADGKIEVSAAWRHQKRGGHVSDPYYNKHSIGIVLVGNFNKNKPTKRQLIALRVLVQYLMGKFKIDSKNVLMHKEVTATECPGVFFPKQAFMREIRNISVISRSN